MPCSDGQEKLLDRGACDRRVAAAPDAGLPNLPYVRFTQRDRPPHKRGPNLWVLVLVLAGHALVAWLMWTTPGPRPVARRAIAVTLIGPESAPPPPLLPPPPLPGPGGPAPESAPAPAPRVQQPVPRAPGSMTATLEGAEGQRLDLYGKHGQVLLPQRHPPSSAPAYRVPKPQGKPIVTIKSPIKYKPTRFNKDWAPLNQTLGGKLFEKAVDATTATKTVHLPGGLKVKCGVSPLVLFFGCQPPPPPSAPPPKLENDIRLSMPPAQTLTGKKVVLPSSASSTQSDKPPCNTNRGHGRSHKDCTRPERQHNH